jgi:hypothetical protein
MTLRGAQGQRRNALNLPGAARDPMANAFARCETSAANLKFLHHLPKPRSGTSKRKAALES